MLKIKLEYIKIHISGLEIDSQAGSYRLVKSGVIGMELRHVLGELNFYQIHPRTIYSDARDYLLLHLTPPDRPVSIYFDAPGRPGSIYFDAP